MSNNTSNLKTIERLRKNLHIVAACPPQEDIFSREGRIAWEAYTQTCQGYEAELRAAGENF